MDGMFNVPTSGLNMKVNYGWNVQCSKQWIKYESELWMECSMFQPLD